MKFDVITIGGVTEDINFYTHDGVYIDNKQDIFHQKLLAFEYGAKIKIDKSNSFFGGGASNAAVSISRLGLKAAIIATLGRDERGRKIKSHLKKEKIDISLLSTTNKEETGYSFILVGRDNEHIVFSDRAANAFLEISNKTVKHLNQSKWIYMTTLSGKWRHNLHYIFKTKAMIAWNPGRRQILEGFNVIGKYFPHTDILILNKDEAMELVNSDPRFNTKPKEWFLDENNLCSAISGWGVKIVIITMGENGAIAGDGKKIYFQKAIRQTHKVNTTGAGDAFGSAFLAGIIMFSGNIKKALKLGAMNAASIIGHEGPQTGLIHKKDINLK